LYYRQPKYKKEFKDFYLAPNRQKIKSKIQKKDLLKSLKRKRFTKNQKRDGSSKSTQD